MNDFELWNIERFQVSLKHRDVKKRKALAALPGRFFPNFKFSVGLPGPVYLINLVRGFVKSHIFTGTAKNGIERKNDYVN